MSAHVFERAIDIGPPAIEGRQVGFAYPGDSRRILASLDLTLGLGELVVLTGPSGAGKTTLMTLIGALRSLQSGSLRVLGQELYGLSPAGQRDLRRQIGFIFQEHNLFDALTAFKTLDLAMKLCDRRPTQQEALERAGDLLGSLGMADCLHRLPRALSTGQKQRVAIARALAHQPRLVLADEPTASLDAEATKSVMRLLRRQADDAGVTVLIVSHDPQLFEAADRVLVMRDGGVAERDPARNEPEEAIERFRIGSR